MLVVCNTKPYVQWWRNHVGWHHCQRRKGCGWERRADTVPLDRRWRQVHTMTRATNAILIKHEYFFIVPVSRGWWKFASFWSDTYAGNKGYRQAVGQSLLWKIYYLLVSGITSEVYVAQNPRMCLSSYRAIPGWAAFTRPSWYYFGGACQIPPTLPFGVSAMPDMTQELTPQ